MAVEPILMQVIEKNTNNSKNKINLTVFETSIKDIIRKIKAGLTPTLSTVSLGDNITVGLFADVKIKQEKYKTQFADYVTEISDYSDTDPRLDITPYTSYSYNYSTMTDSIIEADDEILYQILAEIMNNEGYYYERRVSTRNILWDIRNLIVDTGIFGQYEADQTKMVTFTAKTYENLILDDIYDIMEGGEEALQLKKGTLTVGAGASISTNFASDEILYSIDSLQVTSGSGGSITVYVRCNDNGTSQIIESTTTNRQVIPIYDTVLNSLASVGINGGIKLTSDAGTTGVVYYTVRKVAVYT